MRILGAIMLLLCAGALAAQASPSITVTVFGTTPMPTGGSMDVVTGQPLGGAGISYNVSHTTPGTTVSVSASVTNLAAAVNWGNAEFSAPLQPTPYNFSVTSPTGTFGAAGTVHVVSLTISDGTNTINTGFTINVKKNSSGGGGGGDSGGGGCAAGAPMLPGSVLFAGALAAIRRRRRQNQR
ncbi:MAG: hypothetical protein KF696_07420 [Planctomycetes bacterium]|nr:hypothetical protein [Planctomycetota bacterium]MCW8135380.1 hypothetical protein [Planctomycetota bacterium]